MIDRQYKINELKRLLNQIRDVRLSLPGIHLDEDADPTDELSQEKLYVLKEGFREGLCAAALILADELDFEVFKSGQVNKRGLITKNEENWWHSHNDKDGDVGSADRYKVVTKFNLN